MRLANGRNVRAVLSGSMRLTNAPARSGCGHFVAAQSFPVCVALGGRLCESSGSCLETVVVGVCRGLALRPGLRTRSRFRAACAARSRTRRASFPASRSRWSTRPTACRATPSRTQSGEYSFPALDPGELHHQGGGAGLQDLRAARHPRRHAAVHHARRHARSRHRGGVDHRHGRRAADRNLERVARRGDRRQDASRPCRASAATCS